MRKKLLLVGALTGFCLPALGWANRQLVIDEDEAVIIRAAMARYVELRSVRLLADELARQGVRTRAVTLSDGRIRGGVPFGRGGLRHLLQNRLYLGEVEHKGKTWPGEHQPIVTPDLWQEVQDVMRSQSRDHRHGIRARTPSLLSGLLFDGHGRAMSPSHAAKHGKRYRYYITHPRSIAVGDPSAWRLPAHDLEHGIIAQLAGFLSDAAALTDALGTVTDLDRYQAVIISAATAAAALTSAIPAGVREVLLGYIVRIDLADATLTMTIRIDEDHSHCLTAAHAIVRRGNDVALLVEATTPDPFTRRDEQLVALICDAHAARQAILDAPDQPFDTVASRLGMGIARLKRLLRLASLGPSIVEAILDGTQPDDLTAAGLNTLTHIPLDWSAQRTMLGLD